MKQALLGTKYRWRPKGPKEPRRCRVCGSTHACKPTVGTIMLAGREPVNTVAMMCKGCRSSRRAAYGIPIAEAK